MTARRSLKASPPDHLRAKCARMLPRLQLIPEFEPWLDVALEHYLSTNAQNRPTTQAALTLWHCFALGAPLCVLLDMLGNANRHRDAANTEPEALVQTFIDGVLILEAQGRLSPGEILRLEDLFGGTYQGFAKLLGTVERILSALQATYPGLYVLPFDAHLLRYELFEEMIGGEKAHMEILVTMTDSSKALFNKSQRPGGMVMECLATYLERLTYYHENFVVQLMDTHSKPHLPEDWNAMFLLKNKVLRATAMGALRSYCIHYLTTTEFLEDRLSFEANSSISAVHVKILQDHLSEPLHRVFDHQRWLKDILELTSPVEHEIFDSICLALHKTSEIAEEINEMGLQMRSMRSARYLERRITSWDSLGLDADNLGSLLLDDLLLTDASSGILHHAVFLFDSILLCCQNVGGSSDGKFYSTNYPIANWEFGPAMSGLLSMDILFSVPVRLLRSLCRVSKGTFEINWEEHGTMRTHAFTALFDTQCDQWCSSLQALMPIAPTNPRVEIAFPVESFDNTDPLHWENELGGRRKAYPKPWSLIGRKGPRSVSSSVIRQEHYDHGLPSSPNMLPSFFYGGIGDVMSRSSSPSHLSIRPARSISSEKGPNPESVSNLPSNPLEGPVDLTGKVFREGKYPCAHGGFADVWKGTWRDDVGHRKVAIKVLRSRTDDPITEIKMHKRLRRELSVWQRLNHENVLALHGVVTDFGHYPGFVCPWLENGTISRYLEKRGDVLSLVDRLQVLSEVAAGLSYLHISGVVHGDLTGANILITDNGSACLCDFGLSSIAAEFQGTSYITSTLGGNVRWAAPELYHGIEEGSVSTVNTHSDVYSYGSVTLEVLSGHVPFSYLLRDAQVVMEVFKGVKPRRPATPYVTNQLWDFINQCWKDDPKARPDAEELVTSMHGFLKGNRRNTS
ncbi:hypothetical protein FIBSPDRAFT_1039924 [Athelia psychrophila]|uniref:Uncharacterized protein n=1 Tax=Athelia psychrophila TaxID=1759441 RepID=A0A166R630_9AGAM|nr:hypothetical protein FIBSPDRAFT_1039924 [Fibularhizoctonia sp. CBS 109695]